MRGKTLDWLCRSLGVAVATDLALWDEAVRMLVEGVLPEDDSYNKIPEPIGMPASVPIGPCSEAAHYLARRGFGPEEAAYFGLREGIGKLEHRIVIPTFDAKGEVAYWVARACSPRAYGPKYMNPPGSSARFYVFNLRGVVGAAECRINEGSMSAMASGRFGTATNGKHMSRWHERAYVEAGCGRYVVAYDGTARLASLNAAEKLREDGQDVWVAVFPDEERRKDPASMPSAEREAVYAAAYPYSSESRLRVRAEMLLC